MNSQFFQPRSLYEVLQLRKEHRGADLLAGGTDLVIALRNEEEFKKSIIDLSKVNELKEIQFLQDEIKIGSMVTFTEIIESTPLNEKVRILCRAAESVGAPQIRNRGTVGGNICNASPAADLVPPLICLDASVELLSIGKEEVLNQKKIPLQEFILGSNKTLLQENEILMGVFFKIPSKDLRMNFSKIGRRNALAVARVNGACSLKFENNIITELNLVLGSVLPKSKRFTSVENYLIGKRINSKILKKAGDLAAEEVLKEIGRRPSSSYKLPVISRFTASLIEQCLNGMV